MDFDVKFKEQAPLVQILLVIYPVINWITETLAKASAWQKIKVKLN